MIFNYSTYPVTQLNFSVTAPASQCDDESSRRECNKKNYSHTAPTSKSRLGLKRYSPGIFFVHCLCCGIIVGFHFLDRPESSLTFFEVVYSRRQKCLKMMMFDFVCGCHLCSMSREPGFFQIPSDSPLSILAEKNSEKNRLSQTVFLGDRLHAHGHKCGQSFSPDLHEHHRTTNTSLAEQNNFELSHLETKIRNMTFLNAAFHVREEVMDRNQALVRMWN